MFCQNVTRFVRKDLLAESEPGDRRAITIDVFFAQIGKQPAAAANHLEQTTARVMIVPVLAQVIGQAVDPFRQQRDLDFRRTGVRVVQPKAGDNFFFLNCFQRHAGGASFAGAPINPWAARVFNYTIGEYSTGVPLKESATGAIERLPLAAKRRHIGA
jgi:hypothetical protein